MTRTQNQPDDNGMIRITRWIIKHDDRLNALPKAFGDVGLLLEGRVYDKMEFLTADYRGGYWEYFTLSNGGFLMTPKTDRFFRVVNPLNYSDENLTAEACAICAMLMAISEMSFEWPKSVLAERFHQLRDFALQHPEAEKILKVID